jgi:hypothetical protein
MNILVWLQPHGSSSIHAWDACSLHLQGNQFELSSSLLSTVVHQALAAALLSFTCSLHCHPQPSQLCGPEQIQLCGCCKHKTAGQCPLAQSAKVGPSRELTAYCQTPCATVPCSPIHMQPCDTVLPCCKQCLNMYLHAYCQHPTTVHCACVALMPQVLSANTRPLKRCDMHRHAAVMHAVRMQLTQCLGQPRPPLSFATKQPSNKPRVAACKREMYLGDQCVLL